MTQDTRHTARTNEDAGAVSVQITSEFVGVDGQQIPVPSGRDGRQVAVEHVARSLAAPLGRSVLVAATDADGVHWLEISATEQVTVLTGPPVALADLDSVVIDDPQPVVEADVEDASLPAATPGRTAAPTRSVDVPNLGSAAATGGDIHPVPLSRRQASGRTTPVNPLAHSVPVESVDWEPDHVVAPVSFLATEEDELGARTVPAAGFYGFLERLGLRKPASPSPQEVRARMEERLLSQHWDGPRTIAICNPKGSANKTPTTAMLSALFALYGGGGVLAWDNNETRGTLGWRTEQGPHQRHVRDLLNAAPDLLAVDARVSDMSGFVHHQSDDRFDVLRSTPHSVRPEDRISAEELHLLHQVATRYYRLLVMDSGNNEASPNWLAMIDHADLVVVATTSGPDQSESARLMLENLLHRDERSAQLARSAITVISQVHPADAPGEALVAKFEQLCGSAVSIPMDPGMRAQHLRVQGLQQPTRDAWRHAAATVATCLGDVKARPMTGQQ